MVFDDGNPTERLGEGILSFQKSVARTQDGIQVRTLQSQEGEGTQGNRQGYFSSRAWMMGVGGQESSADNRYCTVAQCHSPAYCLPIV